MRNEFTWPRSKIKLSSGNIMKIKDIIVESYFHKKEFVFYKIIRLGSSVSLFIKEFMEYGFKITKDNFDKLNFNSEFEKYQHHIF